MSPRHISEPTTDEHGNQEHPAFGVAVVTHASSSGSTLFQSNLLHQHTMILRIHHATRKRDLNHDWVHPGKLIAEVEMSLSQWGSLVSSVGLGSGVPVTLRHLDGQPIDDLPHQPRIAANLDEVSNSVEKLLASVSTATAALAEAIEQKKGVRAIREALRNLQITVANTPKNASFAVRSLDQAAEEVVNQARADIETQILTATRLLNEAPSIAMPVGQLPLALPQRPEPDQEDPT